MNDDDRAKLIARRKRDGETEGAGFPVRLKRIGPSSGNIVADEKTKGAVDIRDTAKYGGRIVADEKPGLASARELWGNLASLPGFNEFIVSTTPEQRTGALAKLVELRNEVVMLDRRLEEDAAKKGQE